MYMSNWALTTCGANFTVRRVPVTATEPAKGESL
jgi:hypothetical protein